MKILSMTATFGKLEHETLELREGLNVITAGNEWGKSTWCAFLTAMLYGLDTRAKTTKATLAEKERYAPWSGSPMAGRVDLIWQDRAVTIERKTTGRIPLGDFRAYETDSGLEIPELTAGNCGQKLLGVERSVFLRSGFIRFRDLGVTDDEALRRRLNNLVTTGDENSAADRLAGELRNLKNRIRYNRTGLLPQAEAEREQLEQTLQELEILKTRQNQTRQRLEELDIWQTQLENHSRALEYARAREAEEKVARAAQARDAAAAQLRSREEACAELPKRETAAEVLGEIHRLLDTRSELETSLEALPPEMEAPEVPEPFRGLDPEPARDRAKRDFFRYWKLRRKRDWLILIGLVIALAAGALAFRWRDAALICGAVSGVVLGCGLILRLLRVRKYRALEQRYGQKDPEGWLRLAEEYSAAEYRYRNYAGTVQQERQRLAGQLLELRENIREATQDQGLEQCCEDWEGVIRAWDDRADAQRELELAQGHLDTLVSMVRPVQPPEQPDTLECTREETARYLEDCAGERNRLENLMGQYRGRMESLGAGSEIEVRLAKVRTRIAGLERSYAALCVAQETLAEATAELQRRFAPRIARRAQELMEKLTDGRYDRLSLGQDLSIRSGSKEEDILHEILWRSDGTADQLYLALRLAVAEAILPEAPLILDDALVRFDDKRLKAAMEILKSEAEKRQVIVFTCHSREKNYL